jgi:4-hydroxy-tetrahydrodipicolinate synthase
MEPLSASRIRGTWGTLLLPLNADDTIDYGRLEGELDAMAGAGLDGLYTNGTSGEFHTQTGDEFDRISNLVATKSEAQGIPFQLGCSHPVAQISLERVRRARQLRPGAIQVILPEWLVVDHDEAVAFLQRIAEAADPIGLVLYNPAHAKRLLTVAEIARLHAAVPALVGVKIPDGKPSWYAAVRRRLSGLSVFVPGHHLATGLLSGAHGSYSNIACLSPRGAVRWNRLMQADPLQALEIERRLQDFLAAHIAPLISQGLSGAAVDKLLCTIGGWCDVGVRMRWPYKSVSQDQVDYLLAMALEAVPDFLPGGVLSRM